MLCWSNFRHGIAAEPDLSSRQLQEKAGGVMPVGLFSCRSFAGGNQAMRSGTITAL
jgi:hypothetical protein